MKVCSQGHQILLSLFIPTVLSISNSFPQFFSDFKHKTSKDTYWHAAGNSNCYLFFIIIIFYKCQMWLLTSKHKLPNK